MKKLIAIAVVFTLLVPFAFADVSIGGSVGFGARLFRGDTGDESDIVTELGNHWISTNMTWLSDDGTAGSKLKINGETNKGNKASVDASTNLVLTKDADGYVTGATATTSGDIDGDIVKLGGRIWWRPIEQLKIDFYHLEDEGIFGRAGLLDWGIQSNSAANNVTSLWTPGGWNSFSNGIIRSGAGFFGGLGNGTALGVSLFPIDALTVNVGWELGGAKETVEFFKDTKASVIYGINGIGEVSVSYQAAGWGGWINAHDLYADFKLYALNNMTVELGARIPIFNESAFVENNDWWSGDMTLPIEIGLGFQYGNYWGGDQFVLFSRAGVVLPGDMFGSKTPLLIALDVVPSYDLGIFRAYFDVGFGIGLPDEGDSGLVWHFNPYIKKSLGIGDLYAGINVWNGTTQGYEVIAVPTGTDIINWAIPFYFETSF